VLIFSVINIVRIFASLEVPSLDLSVPTWYFSITGALWGGIGLALSIGLYTGRRWASILTRWLSLVYVAWYWLDRLLFVKTDYARGSTVATIGASILGLSVILWTLLRPKAVIFFKETSS
jgi:hypothetical protein